MDRIAQAFGYDPGYFTAPRIPLPRDVAAASMVEQFSNLEVVPVAAMKTHRQGTRAGSPSKAGGLRVDGVPEASTARSGPASSRPSLDRASLQSR